MEQGNGLLQVAIDFPSSHLFFPQIMLWVLAGLALLIAVVHGREIAHNVRTRMAAPRDGRTGVDARRVLGTLGLVVVYFILMEQVGRMFPNEGFGFLFMSMPFMFALSLLYMHDRTRRKVALAAIVSVTGPLIAWYVLGRLFWITLP